MAEKHSLQQKPADFIIKMLASGFGFGYFPFASGTVGALWGIGIYLLMIWLNLHPIVYAVVTSAIIIGAIPITTRAEILYKKKDSPCIVLDEIVSVPVTMFLVPFGYVPLIAGFLLNRIFDIVKPPPAHALQKLKGGLGVVIDDIIAGIYSCVVLHLILWLHRTYILTR